MLWDVRTQAQLCFLTADSESAVILVALAPRESRLAGWSFLVGMLHHLQCVGYRTADAPFDKEPPCFLGRFTYESPPRSIATESQNQALVLTQNKKLGMITPFGGISFVVGWVALALQGFP